jgi:hypothetical protein
MSPHEVKFLLDAKLLALARGGRVPVITGVHSVVVEGDTVFVGYDLLTDQAEDLLFFEYQRPDLVSPDDVRAFSVWLAWSDYGETVH